MAITSEVNKVTYNCTGASNDYEITFDYIADTSDNAIGIGVVYVETDGTQTDLIEGIGYTISGSTVTTTDTYTSGTLTIYRANEFTQESDWLNGGLLDADVMETAFDKLTLIAQELNEQSSRVLTAPIGDGAIDMELPAAADRASYVLGFSATGEPIAATTVGTAISSYIATLVDDEDSEEARATLGVYDRRDDRRCGLLIPLYVYPAGAGATAWDNLIDLIKRYHHTPVYVVVNQNNGDFTSVDANYLSYIPQLKGAGATVLGYVYSSNAARDIEDIKTNMDSWDTLYDVDGYFVDEMDNTGTVASVEYYEELCTHARAKNKYPLIGNAGTSVPEEYFTPEGFDVVCTYENLSYPSEATLSTTENYENEDYNKRAILVHTQTEIEIDNFNLMRKYAGMVYVTDDSGANPWDSVSSFLEQMLATLEVGDTDTYMSEGRKEYWIDSNVSHAFSADIDSVFYKKEKLNTGGGILETVYGSGAAESVTWRKEIYTFTDPDNTESTAGAAVVEYEGFKSDGAGNASALNAADNFFGWVNNDDLVAAIKGDGAFWSAAGIRLDGSAVITGNVNVNSNSVVLGSTGFITMKSDSNVSETFLQIQDSDSNNMFIVNQDASGNAFNNIYDTTGTLRVQLSSDTATVSTLYSLATTTTLASGTTLTAGSSLSVTTSAVIGTTLVVNQSAGITTFLTVGGDIAVNTDAVYIGSTGYITIKSDSNVSETFLTIKDSDSTNMVIVNQNASGDGFINLYDTTGTQRVQLSSDTGTASTIYSLYVNNYVSLDGSLYINTSAIVLGPTGIINIRSDGNVSETFLQIKDSDSVNQFIINQDASGNAYINLYDTSGTQAVSLSSNSTIGSFITTNLIIGTSGAAPDGTLHVHTGSAGTVTAGVSQDDLVIENNGNAGMTILSPDADFSIIAFGSPTDATGAEVTWNYSTLLQTVGTVTAGGILRLRSGNGTEAIRITSDQKISTGGVTAPDVSTGGICLNQGAEDTNIMTFKSSDISHNMTTQDEADTYASFEKISAANGGLNITGYSDADAYGLRLTGCNNSNTPSSAGGVQIRGYKYDGTTSVEAFDDDETVMTVTNGTNIITEFIGNGALHAYGGIRANSARQVRSDSVSYDSIYAAFKEGSIDYLPSSGIDNGIRVSGSWVSAGVTHIASMAYWDGTDVIILGLNTSTQLISSETIVNTSGSTVTMDLSW